MARTFSAASSQYLSVGAAPVSGYPLTVSAWVRVASLAANRAVISIGDSAAASSFVLFIHTGGTVRWRVNDTGAGTATGITSTTLSTGVWAHVIGTSSAANDHRAYLNGGGEGADTLSFTPTSLDTTSIGSFYENGAHALFFEGEIADVVILDVALTATEALQFYNSRKGHFYKTINTKGYWRLGVGSPEPDWSGRVNNMTLNGTPTVADHPYTVAPFGADREWSGAFTSAGSTVPRKQRYYRNRRVA